MKKISLIFLLVAAVVLGNAQNNIPSLHGNKKGTNKEQAEKTNAGEESAVTPENKEIPSLNPQAPSSSRVSSDANAIIERAVENAFLVVKSDYNVRDNESGSNVSGNDFFGTVYSVVPLLAYGYGVDNRFLKPWKSDPKFDANKYGEDLVSVDNVQYKMLKDKEFRPFDMNKTVSEMLASGFYNVLDTTFHNLGLGVETGDGMKSGYMVWFSLDDMGETHCTIIPTTITFNENTIFNLRQPANPASVIGGAFLNMNVDEPGCIRFNLMGMARMDPYGSRKWELVKMLSQPTASGKSASDKKNQGQDDDSIIPEKDNNKGKKKGKNK